MKFIFGRIFVRFFKSLEAALSRNLGDHRLQMTECEKIHVPFLSDSQKISESWPVLSSQQTSLTIRPMPCIVTPNGLSDFTEFKVNR
ncbi:hypothetical protein M404DRAFT_1007071 [Pisolithus tinctorius Marx 270]|uniref:Uncharacterized protein n=1 Tax=Pisolithus tinctorius Marx 270 TaxID=870435 RepID=A0A0C3JEI1_PISTI|nr:hypothetical protein M404DRAFT_1007071 [Pisolithus tinctorius Marx 270]